MAVQEEKNTNAFGLAQQDTTGWTSSNEGLWSQQSKSSPDQSNMSNMWQSDMFNSGAESAKTDASGDGSKSKQATMWGQGSSAFSAPDGAFGGSGWLNSLGSSSGKSSDDGSNKASPGSEGLWNAERSSDADGSSLVSGLWNKGGQVDSASSALWGGSPWENNSRNGEQQSTSGGSDGSSSENNSSMWNNAGSASSNSGTAQSKWASSSASTPSTASAGVTAGSLFNETLWQDDSAAGSSTNSSTGGAAGAAVGRPQSKEDLIAKYVNSHEGWGKTPIRQDTPWDLTEEPRPLPMPDPAIRRQRSQSSSNGVAIWESSRTTSISDGGSSDNAWDSDNDGMGGSGPSHHRWNRNSESSMSRNSSNNDDHMGGGTTSSMWNDESSSVKTETGFWEDTSSSGADGGRGGAKYDATISQWGESTQQQQHQDRGDGGWQRSDKQQQQQQSNTWGEGGSIGSWGDSGLAPAQHTDDGTSSWGQTQQGQQDSWGSEGSKQRASPVDWNNSQNWSAQQKKMQMQSGGGGGGGGMPGRSGGPTQMRSQMLQDLVRRGFKKEEAQEALIRHNMDFDSALGELMVIASGQRGVNDMMKGRKLLGANSDPGPEGQGHMVGGMMPPMGMQQQAGGAAPSFPNMALPPPLPGFQGVQSGSLQQQQQMKGMFGPQQGQVGSGSSMMGSKTDAHGGNGLQMQQQQLLQQLQQAVQQGQLSPSQLAQYQQNPSQMVNIGNLAQLNNLLQRLIAEHQQLQAARVPQQQMQLEKLASTIQQVQTQIKQQQLHILSQASQQQPGGGVGSKQSQNASLFPGSNDANRYQRDLASAMGGMTAMSMRDGANGMDMSSSQMSKWKMLSPDAEAPSSASGRFSALPHAASNADFGARPTSLAGGSLTHNASAPDLQAQAGGEGGAGGASLEIEEFVPGRKWQGLEKKADDDPYLTPAQMAGRFSMNRVGDDYVMNTLGKTQSASDLAGQMGGAGGVGGGGAPGVMRQQSMPQNMAASSGRGAWDQQQQQWGAGGMRSAGGGQMAPQQGQFGQGGQRQWNSAGPNNNNRPNNMPGAPGLQQSQQGFPGQRGSITWLLLTNVAPHVDLNVLKMHGACKLEPLAKPGELLAGFTSREGAIRAYTAIQAAYANTRGPKIGVEVLPEAAVQQLMMMMRGGGAGGSTGGMAWPPPSNMPPPMMGVGAGGMPPMMGGGWDDHSSQLLPENLLGGQ